jgi:hypothetical protein
MEKIIGAHIELVAYSGVRFQFAIQGTTSMTSDEPTVFIFHWVGPGYLRVKHCPEVHVGMNINKGWWTGYWRRCHDSARCGCRY